jgi:hypothetical protein
MNWMSLKLFLPQLILALASHIFALTWYYASLALSANAAGSIICHFFLTVYTALGTCLLPHPA